MLSCQKTKNSPISQNCAQYTTGVPSRYVQELLKAIQGLQSQLNALKKVQAQEGATTSLPSDPSSSSSAEPSTANCQKEPDQHTGNAKRTRDGWKKIEGTDYSGMMMPDGRKKGKKVRRQRTFDFTRYNKRHVALLIAYLGWDYSGFASQVTTTQTIEAELFDALIKTRLIESRDTSNYSRCGRTDKGVSAFGQVISIDLRSNLLEGHGVIQRSDKKPSERQGDTTVELDYVTFLNRVLPETIRVLAWSPVDVNFSARFNCLHRTYRYFFPKGDLDIEVMLKAAQKLLGTHDFRNFCKMDVANGVVNFMRTINYVNISPMNESVAGNEGGYQMCVFEIQGKAFLYHQVRCTMALLLLIGRHKEQPEILDRLMDIDTQPCKPQFDMAVDYPLVLYRCGYDGINWRYKKEELEVSMARFQDLWTKHSVRSSIMKTMLGDLVKAPIPVDADGSVSEDSKECVPWDSQNTELLKQSHKLMIGSNTKVYKPILSRPVAESLENRIMHYAKKFKLNDEPTES